MLVDVTKINNSQVYNTDVCILGGGVAGIVLANELEGNDTKVIMLDSGNESYHLETQELYKAQSVPEHFPAPFYSRLRFLGGSSNHWENSTERLDPIDFEKRDWINDSGWPIKYGDVLEYYPAAEQYCGVGKDGYQLDFWQNKLRFKDSFSGSELFHTALAKSPQIPTRFFKKFGSRLVKSKNINIFKNANITDLVFNHELQKVISVKFSSLNKIPHQVNAKIFIMCFGGLENARMLLHFNEKNANKLGNEFDNVGRYFMEHPTIRAAHFFPFKENTIDKVYEGIPDTSMQILARGKLNKSAQIKNKTINIRLFFNKQTKLQLSEGISSAHILADSMNKSETPDNFGSHLVNVLKDADLIAEQYLRSKFNSSFSEDADSFGGYQIISMIEQTPSRNNRIYLGTETDQLNIKKLKIDWKVSSNDKENAWKTLRLFAQDPWLQSIGRVRLLEDEKYRIWGSQLGFGQHHMGTTKMSNIAQNGVVDPSLKVFGTSNFYISGSSVFPTGGHVPPTLTIVALTIKLADELKKIL